jgi:hypothetical protein
MLINCSNKHEELVARYLGDLSNLTKGKIKGTLVSTIETDNVVLIDYVDLSIADELLIAEHIRLDATRRYLEMNYPSVINDDNLDSGEEEEGEGI